VGNVNEAREYFYNVLKIDYKDWNAHLNLSVLFKDAGLLEDARRHKEEAIKFNSQCKAMFDTIEEFRESQTSSL